MENQDGLGEALKPFPNSLFAVIEDGGLQRQFPIRNTKMGHNSCRG